VSGPLPVQGALFVRGRRYPLDGGLGVLHFGAGLFPREAAWRTVSAAGRLPDGRPLALHLAEGLPGVAADDVPDAGAPADADGQGRVEELLQIGQGRGRLDAHLEEEHPSPLGGP